MLCLSKHIIFLILNIFLEQQPNNNKQIAFTEPQQKSLGDSNPSNGKSIFTWLKEKASTRVLEQLDANSDGNVIPLEIIKPYENENEYTATEGENKIAEVIHQEGDRNQDGRMTVSELYMLLLGQNALLDDQSSSINHKLNQKGTV